jgi:hypothetical protein
MAFVASLPSREEGESTAAVQPGSVDMLGPVCSDIAGHRHP